MNASFAADGFLRFPFDPLVATWAQAALTPALQVAADPVQQRAWLRGRGTWFVGVNALDNAADGAVRGVPLGGSVMEFIDALGLTPTAWHRAQVSVVYQGFPQAVVGESAAATRYRLQRDAAHVDGLLPVGEARRRMLREPHGFVLGLPLNDPPDGASPLVVWRGSHKIMGAAFRDALKEHDPRDWPDVDLTDCYKAARRSCFAQCERLALPVRMGQATLLHRHTLHGVAPWTAHEELPEGRVIAYFRPDLTDWAGWLPPHR